MLTKIILDVPYKDKDQAKLLGAKWDKHQKVWYIPAGLKQDKFACWIPKQDATPSIIINDIGLMRNIISCWSCKGYCTVYAVYTRNIKALDEQADPIAGEGFKPGFYILSEVSTMPEELLEFLSTRCQNYRIGKVNTEGYRSYRNHCDHCSMGLSDARLHKPGKGFHPKKLADLKSLQCIALQFFDELQIQAQVKDYSTNKLLVENAVQSDYLTDFI